MSHKILITGGSGYVGAMLVREFSKQEDVDALFVIDKESPSDLYAHNPKVTFRQVNISDNTWQEEARKFSPEIVIHCAWQIRELYGEKTKQTKWNIVGSDNVFDFVFTTPSVKKFIHFSTVASYGAYPTNTLEHRFTEEENFRKSNYLYAEEKRIAELHLKGMYERAKEKGTTPQVFIVRPASITGPRGRYTHIRFGLQSALSGQFKKTWIHRVIASILSFVPITKKWCRQFVHEDDVVNSVLLLALSEIKGEYEAFNLCPPGALVTGKDMARLVGKKSVLLPPWFLRIIFSILWKLTQGKIPTSPGGWKSYSYPIAVDGSKITALCGYRYLYESEDAFTKKEGRYMEFVDKE